MTFHGPLIIPAKVKSGKSGALKALQQFVIQKDISLAVRFDLNAFSRQKISHQISTSKGIEPANYTLISLPLYLVEALPGVIDEIRGEGG